MDFDRKAFQERFALVGACVPSRTTKDVLKNVLVQHDGSELSMTASDGECHIRSEMESNGEKFAALLPHARVMQILNEVTAETITLNCDAAHIELICGPSRFRLGVEDPKNYPQVPTCDRNEPVKVSGSDLRRMLSHTRFCTDMDSTRYALGGVQFGFAHGRLTLAATDSRRLSVDSALAAIPGDHEGIVVVVPMAAVKLLEKAATAEVEIVPRHNDISFFCEDTTIITQLVTGRFPDWKKVVPSDASFNGRLSLVAKHWWSLIRQASITTNEESRAVDCQFTKEELICTSTTADIGSSKSRQPIAYDGKEMTLSVDPRYLGDFLKAAGDASVEVKLIASDDRMLMEVGEWRHVIMPISRD